MIEYDPGRCQLWFIWSLRGSVFPRACLFAVSSGLVAIALNMIEGQEALPFLNRVVLNNAAYSGFSFVVGFLLVFRTSQAYSRFWEGATRVHEMRSKWCDAYQSLVAFSRVSKRPDHEVLAFQHILMRLFSLMHGLALQQMHTGHVADFAVIDLGGLDNDSLSYLKRCPMQLRLDLVSSWIHQLISNNLDSGILPVAGPIQSRVFQELSNGTVAMNIAQKIASIPFPFPYAQMTTVLLLLHWFLTPVVMVEWTTNPIWAFTFTFTPVLSFWCINLIASEIEQPFGDDDNDLATHEMQMEMNKALLLMLDPKAGTVPQLNASAELDFRILRDHHCHTREPPPPIRRWPTGLRDLLVLHPKETLGGRVEPHVDGRSSEELGGPEDGTPLPGDVCFSPSFFPVVAGDPPVGVPGVKVVEVTHKARAHTREDVGLPAVSEEPSELVASFLSDSCNNIAELSASHSNRKVVENSGAGNTSRLPTGSTSVGDALSSVGAGEDGTSDALAQLATCNAKRGARGLNASDVAHDCLSL